MKASEIVTTIQNELVSRFGCRGFVSIRTQTLSSSREGAEPVTTYYLFVSIERIGDPLRFKFESGEGNNWKAQLDACMASIAANHEGELSLEMSTEK